MEENNMFKKANYIQLIYKIVNYFKNISIVKCTFLAFCINNCVSEGDNISFTKYSVFEKILSRLNSKFLLEKNDFSIIIDCLEILKNTEYILIDKNEILITSKKFPSICDISIKETKILEEVKVMTDSWFMEEIINYV